MNIWVIEDNKSHGWQCVAREPDELIFWKQAELEIKDVLTSAADWNDEMFTSILRIFLISSVGEKYVQYIDPYLYTVNH